MYSSPESGSASRKESSVVPGLPKRYRTPEERRISITMAATFMAETLLEAGLFGQRSRRGRTEAAVALVDLAPDLRHRRSRLLHAHHVTRDVQAEGSRRGVAGERHPVGRFRLHVTGSVGSVAEPTT